MLASRYDLAGTVESLPGEHDQNFRVNTDSGERFVLKISNLKEDLVALDLQMEALEFLAEREVGFRIPRTIPTKDGESRFSFSESRAPSRGPPRNDAMERCICRVYHARPEGYDRPEADL